MKKVRLRGILKRMKKMSDAYFKDVKSVGDLYIDHILYEFEGEPIVFICRDEVNRDMYLSLCSEIRFGQKWVLVKSTVDVLRSLIYRKTDIAGVFLAAEEVIVITMDLEGNERSEIKKTDEMDRFDLPEEGLMIRCDEESARIYLRSKERTGSVKEKASIGGRMNLNMRYIVKLDFVGRSDSDLSLLSKRRKGQKDFLDSSECFRKQFSVGYYVTESSSLHSAQKNLVYLNDIFDESQITQAQIA